ncbi:putative acyltransferase [Nocardioidaceae bacterium Broad-1]|nr:putative acyltransferase [Nocardioidaceae bacterium Broad-1]
MSGFWKETVRDIRLMKRGWRWGHRAQVPRSAEPFVPPATTTVFDNEWSRKPAARAVREVAQAGLEAVFRSQVKTQVEGLDVLDRLEGPVIFVANHASHLDTPAHPAVAPGPVATQDRGGGRGGLLLRHLVAGRGLLAGLQHAADRPPWRRALDPAGGGARRGLVAGRLPRGHPVQGRHRRPVPVRRRLPGDRVRRPGRPDRPPRHLRGDAARG